MTNRPARTVPTRRLSRTHVAAWLGAASIAAAAPALAQPGSTPAPLGCVIEPARTAEVAAAVPGVLETVLVDRGAVVRRGQVIATLHAEVERAATEAARTRAGADGEISALAATRDLARVRMKRMHTLNELQGGSRLELETAVAEFEIADHRLQQGRDTREIAAREHELSRRQLELRTIRSPIDGVVADRLLQPGERVDGRPILRLVGLDRLRVEVVVPAARFGQVREGASASVRAELPEATQAVGRVVQVDRFVDAASGTFRARIALANPDGRMPAGVRCQVAFDDRAAEPMRPASARPDRFPAPSPSASPTRVRSASGLPMRAASAAGS